MSDSTASAWLVWDERFREHQSPAGHPERPERLSAVRRGLDDAVGRGMVLREVPTRTIADATLERAHPPRHIEAVARASARGGHLDGDTYTSAQSDAIARMAVAAAIDLGEAVLGIDGPDVGFAAVRPPGHHAETDRAMGFCLYSNVAVAALELKARGLARRIAIVDWDVHHGNGTEHILRHHPDLLYVSLHQYPFYPGTGSVRDIGKGDGAGWTVNLPLPAFTDDGDVLALFDRVVVPVLEAADVDFVLVSAGYDAHMLDPLASIQLTADGYGWMTQRLLGLGRPIAAVLEGGYHPTGLAEGVAATLDAFGGRVPSEDPPPGGRVAEVVGDMAVELLKPHWPGLE